MILIFCDNRVLDKLLVYPNVPAQHVVFSSPSYRAAQSHSSHEALTLPLQLAPYQHGLRQALWIPSSQY